MVTKIQNNTGFWKRAAIAAFGFGVGGALWGLEAYRGTVGAGESFTNPFSYILGAVALAVFGGLSLAYLSQINGSFSMSRLLFSKNTLKIIGLGLVGWVVAFFLPAVWVYQLLLLGGQITVIFELFIRGETIDKLFSLQPSLGVGYLWIEFFLAGAIVGLVYSLILKTRILRTILWSAVGFALAALVGPILGNLIGNLFNSFLASYTLTFTFLCAIMGACVYGGIYGSLNKAPSST